MAAVSVHRVFTKKLNSANLCARLHAATHMDVRACGRAGVLECGRAGVRACWRAGVRARGRVSVRACGRADVHECMHVCMLACMWLACLLACVTALTECHINGDGSNNACADDSAAPIGQRTRQQRVTCVAILLLLLLAYQVSMPADCQSRVAMLEVTSLSKAGASPCTQIKDVATRAELSSV
eukprot:4304576-Lingulodinium_polyedra.AAC.1